jgi:exosortase family protein XrtF
MIKEYREAIIFLVKYVVIYLVLNTAYSYYVNHYSPDADPLTIVVTQHTEGLLSLVDRHVGYQVLKGNMNVPVTRSGQTVMMVYEGCNSINVIIVFLAFIISFKGPLRLFIRYFLLGLLAVYLINLFRLMGLYAIALHSPDNFYFFHKFFFTGIIYTVVFIIWYFWMTDVKRWRLQGAVRRE